MDIYTYLRKDHKHVDHLMERLLATISITTRRALFAEIDHQLTLHAVTEEETFYAALEHRRQTEEKIEHAEDEHDEIKEYLGKLRRIPMESEEWIEQFGEFRHSVMHHVREEEGEIFAKAKKILSDVQAEKLAFAMDEMKKEILEKQKSTQAA